MWYLIPLATCDHDKKPILEDGINSAEDPNKTFNLNWNTMVPPTSEWNNKFKRLLNGSIVCKSGVIDITNPKIPSCDSEATSNCHNFFINASDAQSKCNNLLSSPNFTINKMNWSIKYNDIESGFTKSFSGDPTISNYPVENAVYTCILFPTDQISCGMLHNFCSLNHFNQNHPSCYALENIQSYKKLNSSGYYYWPEIGPFYKYNDIKKHIFEEEYITSKFNHFDELSLYLSRYSLNGSFIGYKKIILDLTRCRQPDGKDRTWTKFGTNFKQNCIFSLLDYLSKGTVYNPLNLTSICQEPEFYELYLGDGIDENGNHILRPVPILELNYFDSSNNPVNRGTDETKFVFTRRFFLRDTWSSCNSNETDSPVIQFAKSLELIIKLKNYNHSSIYPPYLEINYGQVQLKQLKHDQTSLNVYQESESYPSYSFKVTYITDTSKLWLIAQIFLSIFSVITFLFFLFRCVQSILFYAKDGFNLNSILGILAAFFEAISIGIFIFGFIFCFYFFVTCKCPKSSIFTLPGNGKDLSFFFPLLITDWISSLLSLILKLLMNTSNQIFLFDWERQSLNFTGWRRVMIANDYLRLSTKRSFSVPLTLFLILFLLDGLNLQYMGSPIPHNATFDVGWTFQCLRFAFSSLLWLIIVFFQWIIVEFVIWRFLKNPWADFIHLLKTENATIFIMTSQFYGILLHGRSKVVRKKPGNKSKEIHSTSDSENFSDLSQENSEDNSLNIDPYDFQRILKEQGIQKEKDEMNHLIQEESNDSKSVNEEKEKKEVKEQSSEDLPNLPETNERLIQSSSESNDLSVKESENAKEKRPSIIDDGVIIDLPLVPGLEWNSFNTYLSRDFRQIFYAHYDYVFKTYQQKEDIIKKKGQYVGKDPAAAYEELNRYMCRFFNQVKSEHKFFLQIPSVFQTILKLPPQVMEDSVIMKAKEIEFKKHTLNGIQGQMILTYILMFCFFEILTESPSIASFVIIIFDFFIVNVYFQSVKKNLGKKCFVDSHFLLD